MRIATKLALSTAIFAVAAIGGSAFCSNQSGKRQPPDASTGTQVIQRSVIKVHTSHGVITLPGYAGSWNAIENAVFIADSIADVQIANDEVPWRISYE